MAKEIDKEAYPYGTVSTGKGMVKMVHVPTFQELHKAHVPSAVGRIVTQYLNLLNYSARSVIPTLPQVLQRFNNVIADAAKKAWIKGDITEAEYSAVIKQVQNG